MVLGVASPGNHRRFAVRVGETVGRRAASSWLNQDPSTGVVVVVGRHRLPSDVVGVIYVPFDDGGGWRLKLAKELRNAGFAIDMNLV